MAHYTCSKCYYTVAAPFCPSCNRFLTDDVETAESVMKPLKSPPGPIGWCTAFGHWGDVFVCVGVMRTLMAERGIEKVNVLYVGPDMKIAEWLKYQKFVDNVIAIRSDKDGYKEFWGATTRPNTSVKSWLPLLWENVQPLPGLDEYTQTHINASWFDTQGGMPAQVWHDAEIPPEPTFKVQQMLQAQFGMKMHSGQLVHLHPISTWSEGVGNHWSHWLAAIEWLIEKTPHTYLLTGLNDIPFLPVHDRLVNFIGKTESNLEVLALSGFCDAIITTPNNVAHWSVIQRQKALVIGNKATEHLSSYYRRFIEKGERVTYLNVNATFSAFQTAACEFLEGGPE